MMKRRYFCILLAFCICAASALFCPLWPGPEPAFAAKDYGGTKWKVEGSRVYIGESGGKWNTGIRARADGGSGDSISMSTSKSVSNSLSGNVGIPLRKLSAAFQFNVSRQWSASASKSYGLTGKKKGSWWSIKYKRIFRNYKVKAREYAFYDGTWHKTRNTRWIKAKKFSHFAYKLCRASVPK